MKRSKSKGWHTIKVLSADETRSIRARELRSAAEVHAEIGEPEWSEHYSRRADEISKDK